METTPRELGYRMPAEWEPHEATWLSWPRPDGISFPDAYHKVVPALVEMVSALSTSEKVCINVTKDRQPEVKSYLKNIPGNNIFFFDIATNEPWCRDHGPIFVKRKATPSLAIIDWDYNAWGGKYPPHDKDDNVPTEVGSVLDLPVFYPKMILEGGSIEVNGHGTVLTSESCLLNPNRNPSLGRSEIEQKLKDYLGVEQILWLGDGIEGDDTDGHIDDLARFVDHHTVVTMIEENKADNNYKPLQENLARLKSMRVEDGTPLDVLTLPMPKRIDREDLRLPASYANFYIANSVILLPIFKDVNDAHAIAVLQELFPTRKVVPIDCRELIWGLGAFHCLTQQQPA